MIGGVGPDETDAVAGRVARLGAGGVVARPGLFGRLGGPGKVTVVAASAGSGKTVLLRSWINQAGLSERAAWVPAGRDERDPQHFWLSVLGALRRTTPGSALVQALTAAPDLDGWTLVERLLTDLAPLEDRVWLVIDDVHELDPQALRQLELLLMRAPPGLRFVLASRHDVRLGLHRLRLEGELAEIRADDLRFSLAEAGELFAAAGVELPESAVAVLHERTEGWAAGLRLAALALAAHPDPAQFAAEFSGAERTVAEYLVAEVLDRQPAAVRLLLLRTSILERVNGELADLLTGDRGGERVLHDLERAGAFVLPLDAARSWFRYHQMFAGLLQLELRRTEPGELAGLHRAAAAWFARHGYPVEAVRHAQAAEDWGLAAGLLADHWPGLYLGGQAAAIHELLAGFPAGVRAADAQLAAVAAADELVRGSVEAAERYLRLAERGTASVPEARRAQAQLLLGVARLLLARQRADLPTAVEEARRLEAMAEVPDPAQYDLAPAARAALGEDLRALALISLGSAELRAARFEDADRHLEHGVALARQIGRPFLEFTGLAYQASAGIYRSFARVAERGMQAIELARRHGWTDEPAAGIASVMLADVLALQGRPEEAEPWVQRAERTVRAEAEPAAGLLIRSVRGDLELAHGRDAEALAALRAAEPLAAPRRTEPAHHGNAGIPAANPGASRRDRACRAGPRQIRRPRMRGRGAMYRHRGAAARPGRPARRDRRARPGPGRLRAVDLAHLADSGVLAGGDRPGRARRRGRRRPGLGARAGPGRARRRAVVVPGEPGAGPAGAPCPAPHHPRLPDRRDPRPACRKQARAAARRAPAVA